MNRREMLKLTCAGSVSAAFASTAPTETGHPPVPQWEIFELTLTGPMIENPFHEAPVLATFSLGHRKVTVAGFYDGQSSGTAIYKVRFMPDTLGLWGYSVDSSIPALQGNIGRFACVAPLAGAHGPVSVRDEHHFAYSDGTPFLPFGTTCYAWIHQPLSVQEKTLSTLAAAPFNKLRMCVFPKHYEYNHNEPELYPFERSADGANNFARPNPAFFQHLEKRIGQLRDLKIEADLILFHPYDRWGFSTMSSETDDMYLRYVLARLSAHRNVWWSMANEFDLMKGKSTQDFDRMFRLIEQYDPVGHLRSIHYSKVMYDYSRPWVSHASLQSYDFDAAAGYLKAWRKPVCFDEIMYEGNLNRRWGNITAQEMTRRFWLGTVAGCYVTHGETFLDPGKRADEEVTQTIWWSHGGVLHGESPRRIAFLRKLIEESQKPVRSGDFPTGLEAAPEAYYLHATTSLGTEKRVETVLYYFDLHQPAWYEFPLPEGTFAAEVIDTWQMTTSPIDGTFRGNTRLELPSKPYQAVKFRRVA